jgi:alcohol dehydrogenase YqhD (iron-dependent ADH family)
MNNFTFHAPTKVFFGQNQLDVLGEQILPFGKKAFLVLGIGSDRFDDILDRCLPNETGGNFRPVNRQDVLAILERAL